MSAEESGEESGEVKEFESGEESGRASDTEDLDRS